MPGPWYDRLPHFKMGFTPSSGKELQSEYFVARTHAVEAIQAVERLRDHVSPHLMITELRTIDGDDSWMSTVLQASQSRHPLHVEAGLGRGQQGIADDRARAGAVRRAAALGQAVHHRAEDAAEAATSSARTSSGWSRSTIPKGKFRNAFLATNLYG